MDDEQVYTFSGIDDDVEEDVVEQTPEVAEPAPAAVPAVDPTPKQGARISEIILLAVIGLLAAASFGAAVTTVLAGGMNGSAPYPTPVPSVTATPTPSATATPVTTPTGLKAGWYAIAPAKDGYVSDGATCSITGRVYTLTGPDDTNPLPVKKPKKITVTGAGEACAVAGQTPELVRIEVAANGLATVRP